MSGEHVGELLARSFDEELGGRERRALDEHLRACAACRQLQAELERAEVLLASAPPSRRMLPPMPTPATDGSRLPVLALSALVLVAAVLGGNALYAYRDGQTTPGAATTAASPVPPTASPASPAPSAVDEAPFRLLVGWPAPGNTIYGILSRVDILTLRGEVVASHDLSGIVGRPAYDGGTRLAYWREAAPEGAFELTLWDASTNSSRILFTSESRVNEPLWSATGAQLVFVLEGGSESPDRLLVLEVASGTVRELVVYEDRPAMYPIYADDRIIAGYARGPYEVIDARTGQLRSSWPTTSVGYGGTQASSDGVVYNLKTNFEAAARPLYLWRIEAPDEPIAVVDDGPNTSLHDPLFRPGHAQLVYGSGSLDIKVIDYATREVRVLRTFKPHDWGWAVAVAFDDSGDHLLVRSERAYQVFAVQDDRLVLVTDVEFWDAGRTWIFGLIVGGAP